MARFTLPEVQEKGTGFTAKTSEIVRQLALAGTAIAWLFLYDSKEDKFTPWWLLPIFIFIVAVLADLFQYTIGAKLFMGLQQKIVQLPDFNSSDEKKGYETDSEDNERLRKVKMLYDWKLYITAIAYVVLFALIGVKIFGGDSGL